MFYFRSILLPKINMLTEFEWIKCRIIISLGASGCYDQECSFTTREFFYTLINKKLKTLVPPLMCILTSEGIVSTLLAIWNNLHRHLNIFFHHKQEKRRESGKRKKNTWKKGPPAFWCYSWMLVDTKMLVVVSSIAFLDLFISFS